MSTNKLSKSIFSTKQLVLIAILGSLATILMVFRFPLPFSPSFMDLDLADVPVLIGGFAYGPLAGALIAVLKNVIKLITQGTSTSFIGELSNIIVTTSFVVTSATIYKSNRTLKGARLALISGVLVMTTIATLSNAFLIFPLFERIAKFPISRILAITMNTNSLVTSYWTMMIFAVVPFNLIKGGLNALLTAILYKYISSYLK